MVAKKESADRLRILMIGPLPPPTGGARVLFKNLIDCLATRNDVGLTVVDTPPVRRHKFRSLLQVTAQVARILCASRKADVIALHTTTSALHVRGPFIRLVARICRIPFLIHTFGGELYRRDYGPVRSAAIGSTLRAAACYLAESREQVEHAQADGVQQVQWFPNTRRLPRLDRAVSGARPRCRRFVFISHVKETKGIREIIEAGERLGADVVVDVYGPFREGMTESIFDTCRRVRYRGELAPDQVTDTLRRYDALLLPTYHPGEGYPGIVIEAYMVGLPVITTRWRRLPEIVDERSGILIEPRDARALHDAMQQMVNDPRLFEQLREGALERRRDFDTDVWVERFVALCRKAVECTGPIGARANAIGGTHE